MSTIATQTSAADYIFPGSDEYTHLLAGIAENASDRDLNDENPFEQVNALKRAGFGTLRLPRELGGAGFTVRQQFSSVIDLARADPIVAHIFRTHFWFVDERLRAIAEPISRQWLNKVAEGKIFGNAFSGSMERSTTALERCSRTTSRWQQPPTTTR
jgi:alkylation response protein AidB-like acyl-CoA dehydrogenase